MTIFTRPQWCIEPLRPQPKAAMSAGLPLQTERGSLVETAAEGTKQKREAGSSGPSSRSDSRDSERAGNCRRNRSGPRYEGLPRGASRSLACAAEPGSRR
jgi:hypothetical protein